jgi:hypothetical protein
MGLGGDTKNRVTGVTRVTDIDKYMILNDLYGVTQVCWFVYRRVTWQIGVTSMKALRGTVSDF